ncbi:hypothetical protein ACFL59_11300 [Planctomycetota bacterium]
MTEDEIADIEDRASLSGHTGSMLTMQPLDVLALCKALREARMVAEQLQRERDMAVSQLQKLEKHFASFTQRFSELEQLMGRRGK